MSAPQPPVMLEAHAKCIKLEAVTEQMTATVASTLTPAAATPATTLKALVIPTTTAEIPTTLPAVPMTTPEAPATAPTTTPAVPAILHVVPSADDVVAAQPDVELYQPAMPTTMHVSQKATPVAPMALAEPTLATSLFKPMVQVESTVCIPTASAALAGPAALVVPTVLDALTVSVGKDVAKVELSAPASPPPPPAHRRSLAPPFSPAVTDLLYSHVVYASPSETATAELHEPAHRWSRPGPSLLTRRADVEIIRQLLGKEGPEPGEADAEAEYPIFREEGGPNTSLDDDGVGSDLTEPPSDPEDLAGKDAGEDAETELETDAEEEAKMWVDASPHECPEARQVVFAQLVTSTVVESFRNDASSRGVLWYSRKELQNMRQMWMSST